MKEINKNIRKNYLKWTSPSKPHDLPPTGSLQRTPSPLSPLSRGSTSFPRGLAFRFQANLQRAGHVGLELWGRDLDPAGATPRWSEGVGGGWVFFPSQTKALHVWKVYFRNWDIGSEVTFRSQICRKSRSSSSKTAAVERPDDASQAIEVGIDFQSFQPVTAATATSPN